MQNLINRIRSTKEGQLIALCARPGDGRRTTAIALANELARQGEAVHYFSYSKSPTALEERLDSAVVRLTASDIPDAGVLIIDDLTAGATALTLATPGSTKIAILSRLRKVAKERGLKILVTDTHARHTSRRLPIPDAGLALCDAVYIAYKEPISADDVDSAELPVIQLKEIV